jgi:hypothetical protein
MRPNIAAAPEPLKSAPEVFKLQIRIKKDLTISHLVIGNCPAYFRGYIAEILVYLLPYGL